MNEKLITKNSKLDERKKFDEERWLNYAKRLNRNMFMRKYIFDSQSNICPWCENEFVLYDPTKKLYSIHHVDYHHQCRNNECIDVPQPKKGKPHKTAKAPDCERCLKEDLAAFSECLKRVVALHGDCHAEVKFETLQRDKERD